MVYSHDMNTLKKRDLLRRATSVGVASMWLHQGFWCKVLDRDPAHRQVLGSLPGLSGRRARVATASLGLAETVLAGLIVARGDRRWVAGLQTALVAGFNAGGLVVGRMHISHPARLLARNGVFIALIWSSVDDRHRR